MMQPKDMRNYGVAFSDAEGSWPASVKAEMKKKGKAIVMSALGPWQKVRFLFAFLKTKRKADKLDLSSLRERGMDNQHFLDTQLEYLAMFAALAQILGSDETVALMKKVMDETAKEPLLLCLPKPEEMHQLDDTFDGFREYLRVTPDAAKRAGCQQVKLSQDDAQAIQMDIHWCVWFELAKLMDIPEACIPNCYSDDLVFPEYFAQFGIKYQRSQTLACGGCKCDFRFERMPSS